MYLPWPSFNVVGILDRISNTIFAYLALSLTCDLVDHDAIWKANNPLDLPTHTSHRRSCPKETVGGQLIAMLILLLHRPVEFPVPPVGK